jgi:hypothetical protein
MDEQYSYLNDNVIDKAEIDEQRNYAPSQMVKSDKADLLDKIRPDLIVEEVRHKLLGETLVDGRWVKASWLKNKALTEEGASDITTLMLSVSSQNISLSKLNNDEIRNRTLEIIRTLHESLLKNWKEYGIKGTDQIGFVHQIVMSNTLITLKQSENEGIRNLIKGVRTETAQLTPYKEEKKGLLGGFFRK